MRILILPFLLLLAACPEESGVTCPPNTGTIGQYALNLAGVDGGTECIASPPAGSDAGPLRLTFDDGGTRSVVFCLGTADGGPEVQMLVGGTSGVRKSPLLADGGFRFVSDPVVGQGTACFCDVTINETFEGYLHAAGPVAIQPDGGLPAIETVTGTLQDRLTDAGTNCRCAFPCTVTYNVSGAPF
jgi:hypothetical protein